MQLSAALVLMLLGAILQSWWIAAAGLMAHIYSIGLAGWDENADLRRRFGDAWVTYRAHVRAWLPRWRPWFAPESAPARLYVSGTCAMCSQVGAWFHARGVRHLDIVAAETHRSRALARITYEDADGLSVSGIVAIARAFEHIHAGWALAGSMMRLPIVSSALQLLIDASGGHARRPAIDSAA